MRGVVKDLNPMPELAGVARNFLGDKFGRKRTCI